MKKVYLAGSITKNDNYKEEFTLAEKLLNEEGLTTIDPTKYQFETYEEYIRHGLKLLLECDYIYYVNDVGTSKGAFIEWIVANASGISEYKKE